jgi:hypothetical protein
MFRRPLLRLLLAACLTGMAAAQAPTAARLRVRTLLHDPLNPYAEFYLAGTKGGLERMNLSLEGIGVPQDVTLQGGTLRLFSSATVDSANPLANLAASTTVPAGLKRAIVLIVPAGANAKPPYKLMLLDDSASAFPWGESRAVNLTALPLAVAAGEHRIQAKPATVTPIPKVTRVNDLNQAHTRFYQQDGSQWVLLSERPTQFTDQVRNLFLLFTMPGVPDVQVRTLIDADAP